ncbi:MAG: serine/threonine protein kinase [Deltaproteobacteria bacterium]|nr:serine/threonine protein kinase [Deltaproteobacteria bacterium]
MDSSSIPGPSALAPGTRFAGDYQIVRALSKGGQGSVYEAKQLSTGNRRALKLLLPELVRDEKLAKRFKKEARVSAKIESDHVVQVMAAGTDAGTGIPWIAMELLKGTDLRHWLHKRGAVPWVEIDELFRQLCHALGAAHAAGIVHRDLKPEHIFLARARVEGGSFMVKVLGFGIAAWVRDATDAKAEAYGTPIWMAPELMTESAEITPAADVWAIGLIAFRMMTGKHYWRSANGPVAPIKVVREIKEDPLEPASIRAASYGCEELIVAGFNAWFARCVDRDPSCRYPDAKAAGAALREVFERAEDRNQRKLARAEAMQQSRHRSLRFGMIAGTLAGLAVALAFAISWRCAPAKTLPATSGASAAPGPGRAP